jgi:hypothetical protein
MKYCIINRINNLIRKSINIYFHHMRKNKNKSTNSISNTNKKHSTNFLGDSKLIRVFQLQPLVPKLTDEDFASLPTYTTSLQLYCLLHN